MNETSTPATGEPASPPTGPPEQPSPGYPAATFPPLTRREPKVVAGVCAGVAYRLGIDPNVVRVLAIVLSIFGGVGILLYAIGWLLMPEQATGTSLGERALRGGGTDGARTILLALGLIVVALGFGFAVVGDSWFGLTVLVLTLAVGAVLLTRRPSEPSGPAFSATSQQATYPPGYQPTYQQPYQQTYQPDDEQPPSELGYIPPYPYGPPPDSAALPEPSSPRSILGPVTAFAALATVGILGVVDALGASLPFSAYVAAALAVVGLGLVVGAWFGRSRGLIALGVALSLVLVPATVVGQLDLSAPSDDLVETSTVIPQSTSELDGAVFEHGAGDLRYDLTDVDFSGADVATQIRIVAGNLQIDVPDDVTLVVDATVAAGQIDVAGDEQDGLGVSTQRTIEGEDGAGTLELDVSLGFGNVEITQKEDAS